MLKGNMSQAVCCTGELAEGNREAGEPDTRQPAKTR